MYHKESCRYVQGTPRTGTVSLMSEEEAKLRGFRPCYVCWPESRPKAKKERNKVEAEAVTSEDDEWEITEEKEPLYVGCLEGGCTRMCY